MPTSPSFQRLSIKLITFSRYKMTSGKESGTPTLIGTYKNTSIYPLDTDTHKRFEIDSPYELCRTFIEGLAAEIIKEDDIAVCDGKNYVVRAIGEWQGERSQFLEVILEKEKP